MAKRKQKQNAKTWKAYVDYLEEYNRRTDWVWRDHPYPEYHQFPDSRKDFREEIDDRLRKEKVMEVLMTLTERERKILIHRFGIEDGVPKTLEHISGIFNVGKERVRSLEARALRKLRHPVRRKNICEPEEYEIRMRIWEERERQAQAEYEEYLAKESEKRAERASQWKRDQDERARREEIAREERYRERQRIAAERWAEIERKRIEDQAIYDQMKAEVDEYDRIQSLKEEKQKQIDDWPKVQQLKAELYRREMEKKAKEYQDEARRPYAWCPRTKTKRYLD